MTSDLHTLSLALRAAADVLDPPTTTPVTLDPAKVRPPGVVTPAVRLGLQYRVLQNLIDADGSMPHGKFVAMAVTAGYGRGYGQFYAARTKSSQLCTLKGGVVTITDKGKLRLKYAKDFLGIPDKV